MLVPMSPVFWLLDGAVIAIFSKEVLRISPWLILIRPTFSPPLTVDEEAEVTVISLNVRFSMVPVRTWNRDCP